MAHRQRLAAIAALSIAVLAACASATTRPSATVLPTAPATPTPSAPMPSPTPSVVSYISSPGVSFADRTNGWALGQGCDAQARCEISVARTSNAGSSWTLVTSPVEPSANGGTLAISASSATDAWVWGFDATGTGVLSTTHDGGHTWVHAAGLGGVVSAFAVADRTAWAVVTCSGTSPEPCTTRVLSAATTGGGWSQLGSALPSSVSGPPLQGPGVPLGQLVRSGAEAWFVASNQVHPAMVRSEDNGQSWQQLAAPCIDPLLIAGASEQELMLICSYDGGNAGSPKQIWTSTDAGSHWLLRSSIDFNGGALPTVGRLFLEGFPLSIDLVDSRTAWIASELDDDYVTHDDGVTWSAATLPADPFSPTAGGLQVTFVDALNGWTTAVPGLWHTVDGGATWRSEPILGSAPEY